MTNSADPDQLASSEANWSGSTLFAKTGHEVFSKRSVKTPIVFFLCLRVFFCCFFVCLLFFFCFFLFLFFLLLLLLLFFYWQFYGGSSVAVLLCACVCGFICGISFVIVCSLSLLLLVPREGCSLLLWHFLFIFTYTFFFLNVLIRVVYDVTSFFVPYCGLLSSLARPRWWILSTLRIVQTN